ncbi:hypothetical protein AAFF_G00122130 [Aldrovandia affinis]|uniref:Uncharacterized protein n=1 Tax=Aldrovandia affinis TaxID=143900 RepID=A0AAD7RS97_9TELE|nr:hypothetical protein AAFF_G00122130 [Aldrovandia affinis]
MQQGTHTIKGPHPLGPLGVQKADGPMFRRLWDIRTRSRPGPTSTVNVPPLIWRPDCTISLSRPFLLRNTKVDETRILWRLT